MCKLSEMWESIALYLIVIFFPILAIYIGYLIVTKAFTEMGFSSLEAVIIVFLSFLLGFGFLNIYGIEFHALPLFSYGNWNVKINTGGAIIPLLLSLYLMIKHKLSVKKIVLGILAVAITTYLVTYPDPQKGIVAQFPYWLLPVFIASLSSLLLLWKQKHSSAPYAYIAGTLGVLIGADVFHLISLLTMGISEPTPAIIGGAVVFDMVFITGILAVVFDSFFIIQDKVAKHPQKTS